MLEGIQEIFFILVALRYLLQIIPHNSKSNSITLTVSVDYFNADVGFVTKLGSRLNFLALDGKTPVILERLSVSLK